MGGGKNKKVMLYQDESADEDITEMSTIYRRCVGTCLGKEGKNCAQSILYHEQRRG